MLLLPALSSSRSRLWWLEMAEQRRQVYTSFSRWPKQQKAKRAMRKKAVELEFFARLNWWDCFDRNQTRARWSCDSIDIVNVKHKKFDVTKQVEIDRSLVRIHYTTQRTTTRWTTRDSREWRFFLTFSRYCCWPHLAKWIWAFRWRARDICAINRFINNRRNMRSWSFLNGGAICGASTTVRWSR